MFLSIRKYSSIFITLLITVLSMAQEQCGQQDLINCAKPLQVLSETSELSFVSKKEELQKLCPDLYRGLRCIHEYTRRCMSGDQRAHFSRLYRGTSSAVKELCTEGKYQERFLQHATCMTKVKPQYEQCASTYQQTLAAVHSNSSNQNSDNIKTVCCSFQAYMACSVSTVRMECGDDSADFTREFLHKVGDTLIKAHCRDYPEGSAQCAEYMSYSSSSSNYPSTIFKLLIPGLVTLIMQTGFLRHIN